MAVYGNANWKCTAVSTEFTTEPSIYRMKWEYGVKCEYVYSIFLQC